MRRMAAFAITGIMLASPIFATATKEVAKVVQEESANVKRAGANFRPTGKGFGTELDARHVVTKANGISYHGGPVMTGTKTVYFIWYGSWTSSSTPVQILPSLVSGLSGSGYFNINTTYTNSAGSRVGNSVSYGGGILKSAYLGTSLSDAQIKQVVTDAINGGSLPRSSSAVYFVLTSKNVTATSGFCTQYCGWHTHASIGGSDVKYAFVGDSTRCASSCQAQATGPNGTTGADGMASILSHELEEAATDPDLNAWYDSSGAENADKCAWTYGSESTASNGAKYNQTLGGRHWLIQQNWVNASGGYCAKTY